MRECEVAWAAGLFDGEGSVYLRSSGRYPRNGATLTLEMTDRATVEAFARILAPYGRLYGSRIVGHRTTLPLWKWCAASQGDVVQVGLALLPYLVTKKVRVRAALETCRVSEDSLVKKYLL